MPAHPSPPTDTGTYNHLVGALAGCPSLEPVPDSESPAPRLLHLSCLWRDSTSALPKPQPAELMGFGQDHSLGATTSGNVIIRAKHRIQVYWEPSKM